MSPWKKRRHALEAAGCRLLTNLLPKLSRGTVVRIANVLGTIAATFDRRGHAVAMSNLECAFGDRFSVPERRRMVRRSYQNFALTMLTLFWSQRLTPDNFQQALRLEGYEELIERMARNSNGVIFMCAHQGNWEWASLAGGFLGVRMITVTAQFKNEPLNAIFIAARQHSGQTIIPQEHSMVRMFKALKRNGSIGLLGDLSFVRGRAAAVVEAWGMKMVIPSLPAALARRTGALLVPILTEPLADGTCRVIVATPIEAHADETNDAIAQRCWDVFQREIDRHPELWLSPYKHFRFRPRGATRPYPSYANESGAFEKILRNAAQPATPEQTPIAS